MFTPRNRTPLSEVIVEVFQSNASEHMGAAPITSYSSGVSNEADIDEVVDMAMRHAELETKQRDHNYGYKVYHRIG